MAVPSKGESRKRRVWGGRSLAAATVGSLLMAIAVTACSGEARPTYIGSAALPTMSAVLNWSRHGTAATGSLEMSGDPKDSVGFEPGTYPVQIVFAGTTFTGTVDIKGQKVAVSGELTPEGVEFTFDSDAIGVGRPTLDFTSTDSSGYSFPPPSEYGYPSYSDGS